MGLTLGSKPLCHWLSRFSLAALFVTGFPALSFAAHKSWKSRFDLFAEGGGSLYQGQHQSIETVTVMNPTVTSTSIWLVTTNVEDSGRLFVGGDFWFTRHDAVQASYSYARADLSYATTVLQQGLEPSPPPSSSQPFGAHFLSVDYLHSFTLSGNWRLLLDAGVGAVLWNPPVPSRNFSANLGAGVGYRLSRHWAVRAEYRDYMERFPYYGQAMLHDHAPTVGLVYQF